MQRSITQAAALLFVQRRNPSSFPAKVRRAVAQAAVPIVVILLVLGVVGVAGFQLPTIFTPTVAPNAMSVRRDIPRHMTVFPGGGSLARAR